MSDPQFETSIRAIPRRQALRLFALGVVGTLAACTKSLPHTKKSSGAAPAGSLNVRHFGAHGDGSRDDTSAITAALRRLRPGQTLVFPAGTYPHSQVLTVDTRGVTLQGPGRLLATAEQTSALRIDAPDVTVKNITVAMGRTTKRWGSEDQHKIFLAPHSGIVLSDVQIIGSAAAGLFSFGARHFRFIRVRVRDTRADGIHMTYGSCYGLVDQPHVLRSGDDGVAVVSYLQDPSACHDISVLSPRVHTTTGGRGLSVVGGFDVDYHEIEVANSNAASVYVACEGGEFVTRDVDRVTVSGGSITGANTNSAIDNGAVLVYSGRPGGSVQRVLITNLTVAGTRPTASRQIGVVADASTDLVRDIEFQNLHLAAAPSPYQGDAPIADIRLVDVQAAGAAVRAGS